MGGEKLSNGVILGQVVSELDDAAIANAIVGLDYVTAQGRRVQLFNAQDVPIQNLNDRTNSHGGFALFFHWDPTTLGTTMDMPSYKLNINLPTDKMSIDFRPAIPRQGRLAAVVSLREVGSGRIPSFKNPTNTENIVKDLKLVLKVYGVKFPNMFLSFGRPSGDYYELIGAIKIAV
jgi:hypothetical protein